jgi:hypothetical protein
LADLRVTQPTVADQFGDEPAADHAGRADHGNVHAVHLPRSNMSPGHLPVFNPFTADVTATVAA